MGHNPHTSHKNPHSVDDYVFRNTKQRGEGEGVRGCVGQNLHPAYSHADAPRATTSQPFGGVEDHDASKE